MAGLHTHETIAFLGADVRPALHCHRAGHSCLHRSLRSSSRGPCAHGADVSDHEMMLSRRSSQWQELVQPKARRLGGDGVCEAFPGVTAFCPSHQGARHKATRSVSVNLRSGCLPERSALCPPLKRQPPGERRRGCKSLWF